MVDVDVATSKHLISASALSKRARGQTAGAKTLPGFASLEVASYQISAHGHSCPALAALSLDPHGGRDGRRGTSASGISGPAAALAKARSAASPWPR